MRVLRDEKTGLVWVTPETIAIKASGEKVFSAEDAKLVREFQMELDTFDSENIKKYVTGQNFKLGEFMSACVDKHNSQYYAFDDGRLVATVLIDSKAPLVEEEQLATYAIFCEMKGVQGIEGYLSLKDAKRALDNDRQNNNSIIEFLAVSPNHQGRGVGTRAVMSIDQNLDFFSGNVPHNVVSTRINRQNIASLKAFKRNGFETIYNHYANEFNGTADYFKVK